MFKKNEKNLTSLKKLSYTMTSSLANQVTAIIAGFILPRLILIKFGSTVNGLTVSITQFLGMISFLDMGVGQVVQANLYAPLAKKDYDKISDVLTSGKKFFRNLARIFLVYICVLTVVYPLWINKTFGFAYTASMIVILSVNSFAQYYFGVSYQILLSSDQKGYIPNVIQMITLILNVIASAVLIWLGCGIHAVKFSTAVIFLLRPFCMWLYVQKNYPKIKLNQKLDYEPIKQKWNGFAQHMATVILGNTDTVVLTLMTSLESVSVYAVYNLVISGVRQIFKALIVGIQPLLGRYWAENNKRKLQELFAFVEWGVHQGIVFLFGCTAVLVVPFVEVYTLGVTDYQYVAFMFGVVLTAAQAFQCMVTPYNMMTFAGGHFKQTQGCFFSAAVINVVISILAVKKFGLVGVAIGTLIAMAYQTLWLMVYTYKNFINIKFQNAIKLLFLDALVVVIATMVSTRFTMSRVSYITWAWLAIKVGTVWISVLFFINILFNKKYIYKVYAIIRAKIKSCCSK